MDMSSLFPADGGLGSVLNAQPRPHVSFKAGILNRDESTNMVTADPRKGMFQIITSPEDNLLHLQWRARNQSTVDHDLIIFNGDTEMKKVTSCAPSARVYVLKWRGANQRMFFWMQGKDPSADEGLIAQVNSILENGPESQQGTRGITLPTQTNEVNATPMDVAIEPGTPPVQPASQPVAPAATATPPPTTSPVAGGPITLEQMRAALPSSRRAAGGNSATDATAALRLAMEEAQREQILTTPTITELLNPQALSEVLQDEGVQAALPNLLQHLPEQDRSLDRIAEILRSPPLRSQAAALSNALQSGQASELLRSFELPDTTGNAHFGLLAFIEALQELEKQAKDSKEQ